MSQPRLRRMTADDIEAVEVIQAASLPNSAAGWMAGDFLKPPLEAWVLAAGGEGVGAFLVARRVAEDEYELLNMAVAPERRRHGLGTALLNGVLDHFPGMWFLEVRASNSGALALYERLGFHRSGRRRGYYRFPAEDAIEMSRPG